MPRKLLLCASAMTVGAPVERSADCGADLCRHTHTAAVPGPQGQPLDQERRMAGANGADLTFSRYSPLDQINASNFDKLQVAWRFKTD